MIIAVRHEVQYARGEVNAPVVEPRFMQEEAAPRS